jgi:hypothetical protein
MKKKRDDEEMNATAMKKTQSTDRKKRIQASYVRAVKANGKALEKLSKN